MSETTLTKDEIYELRDRHAVYRMDINDQWYVLIKPTERDALRDAAERAETLQAQLTEVTRERDEAVANQELYAASAKIAYVQMKAAEAALAPLLAVMEAARDYLAADDDSTSQRYEALIGAVAALPADPSAPTPKE